MICGLQPTQAGTGRGSTSTTAGSNEPDGSTYGKDPDGADHPQLHARAGQHPPPYQVALHADQTVSRIVDGGPPVSTAAADRFRESRAPRAAYARRSGGAQLAQSRRPTTVEVVPRSLRPVRHLNLRYRLGFRSGWWADEVQIEILATLKLAHGSRCSTTATGPTPKPKPASSSNSPPSVSCAAVALNNSIPARTRRHSTGAFTNGLAARPRTCSLTTPESKSIPGTETRDARDSPGDVAEPPRAW